MFERLDRWIVLGIIVLLFALIEFSQPARPAVPDPRPSTLISSPAGTRALYLTLESLGIEIERRYLEWDAPGVLEGPLVVIAPTQPASEHETEALIEWIEDGGTLLYVARAADPILAAIGGDRLSQLPLLEIEEWPPVQDHEGRDEERRGAVHRVAYPTIEHPWLTGVDSVSGIRRALGAGGKSAEGDDALVPEGFTPLLVTEDHRTVVATWTLGAGRVIVWSDAEPLRNRSIRDSGAVLLFARIAHDLVGKDGTLVFDEVHHGFRGDGSPIRATIDFLTGTPLGHATLQLFGVAAGLLLLVGVRFGRPYPPPEPDRRSPLEHVEALASVYRQTGADRTARRLLLAQLTRRLGRRPAVPGTPDETVLDELTTTLPGGKERVAKVRAALDRDDVPGLAHAIDELIAEVKGT